MKLLAPILHGPRQKLTVRTAYRDAERRRADHEAAVQSAQQREAAKAAAAADAAAARQAIIEDNRRYSNVSQYCNELYRVHEVAKPDAP